LVIWPVKVIPEMTYNVLSGTLSLYTTTNVPLSHQNCACFSCLETTLCRTVAVCVQLLCSSYFTRRFSSSDISHSGHW